MIGTYSPKLIQRVDVHGDIELAKNSAQLFSQTLSFTDPTKEDISKNALIQVKKKKGRSKKKEVYICSLVISLQQEFHDKCKQAQQIIAGHLTVNEESDVICKVKWYHSVTRY